MERKIVSHRLATGQVRANGRPVREVKEQEAVRAGKTKCYQVSVSGAGLPSRLSPQHRPRAGGERQHLQRLVQILTGVTAMPCWSQGQEREGMDGWVDAGWGERETGTP